MNQKLGVYEHKCSWVTGHRGPSFVCQKAGHAVDQNSYCKICTCPEANSVSNCDSLMVTLTVEEIDEVLSAPNLTPPARQSYIDFAHEIITAINKKIGGQD